MPSRPLRPCSKPGGCPNLTTGRYCAEHEHLANRHEQDRESAAKRGYGRKWQSARESFLRQNPLCVDCLKEGRYEPATVVDHVIPHKGDQRLFWDRTNWAALCKPHHDAKTARDDGGFGNHGRR